MYKYLGVFVLLALFMATMPLYAQDDEPEVNLEIIGTIIWFSHNEIIVNGQLIDVSQAEINIDLVIDAPVKIKGRLEQGNRLVAETIDLIDDGLRPNELELVGILEVLENDSLIVSGRTINTSNAEVDPTLEIGQAIAVFFSIAKNDEGNSFWAIREVRGIHSEEDGNGEDEASAVTLTGTLDNTSQGIITVAGQDINIANAALSPNLVLGILVTIHVELEDGNILAKSVTLGNQDDKTFVLPGDCSMPQGWTSYTVRSGDTLTRIAFQSQTTVQILTVVNCIENPNLIRPRQVFFVPNEIPSN